MSRSPSRALLLAQAMASEFRDTQPRRALASPREIRDNWRGLKPATRRWWHRKARRVLVRRDVLGPPRDL